MKFFRNPFLLLSPALILGVLFADMIALKDVLFAALICLVGYVLYWGRKSKMSFHLPGILILIFSLGALLMGQTRNDFNTLNSGDLPRIALVEETEITNDDWKKVLITIQREKSGDNWQEREEKVLLYTRDQLREGDLILFHSSIEQIENSGNPGEFDAKQYWKGKNISMIGFLGENQYVLLDYQTPNWLTTFFKDIRGHLSNALAQFLPEQEASVAKALLLGDKSTLSTETRQSFSSAGAMHVLAISGLHVGIIMYLLFFVLKRFSRVISRRAAVIISLVFIWIFVGVTGASPSVVRAALMFSVLLIGQQSGRMGSNLNTLFFSAFVLLLIDPLLIFDIGFQLSYCAMLGIFLYFDRISSLLKIRSKFFKVAWDGTALGIAAQVFTIPLMLYYFHQFPNYFWLTNLGVMLVAGLILGLGMLFFAFKFVPFVNTFLASCLTWALFFLLQFVAWIEVLPASVAKGFVPAFPEMILFYLCVLLLVWNFRKKIFKIAIWGLLVLIIVSWQWDRGTRKLTEEIVVFNANKPVLCIKQGGTIYGFFTEGNKEKSLRYLDPYETVTPGKLNLIELKNGITKIDANSEIVIEKSNKSIKIRVEDKTWLLRLGYSSEEIQGMEVIDMPYLEQIKGHYNLKDGAYKIALR